MAAPDSPGRSGWGSRGGWGARSERSPDPSSSAASGAPTSAPSRFASGRRAEGLDGQMQPDAEDAERGRRAREQRLVEDLLARVDVEVQVELLGQLQGGQGGVDGLLLIFRLGGGNGAADGVEQQS